MGLKTCSVLAALMAGNGAAVTAAQAAECHLAAVAEIPVQVRYGRILLVSKINGQPAFFILDTGASRSLMFAGSASRYALATHNTDQRLFGVGGEVDPRFAEIADLELGSIHMPKAEILVAGRNFGPPEVAGLIGYDVFARYDIEFDLAHSMVRLLTSKGCSDDQMDYWRAPYAVAPLHVHGSLDTATYVAVQLNGAPLDALLDTGSPRTTVTLAGAARAGVQTTSPGVLQIGTAGGLAGQQTPFWAVTFKSFKIGEETIANPTLGMADMFNRNTVSETGSAIPVQIEAPQMLLGLDFVAAHRMIISREHQKLYFSYNGGPIFESPRPRQPDAATAATSAPATAPPKP